MSNFSEYLEKYMTEKSITSAMLAEESNIERTVIYRYIKGKRIPQEIEIVIRMADSLHMNIQEKKQLLEEYDKLTLGELTVNSYKYVCRLMEKLVATEQKSLFRQWKKSVTANISLEDNTVLLNSREEIMSRVFNLFEYALTKESSNMTVHFIMQPIYDSVQNFILPFFEGTNVKIEQIVCLEQSLAKSYKNLEIFQQILPLCFKKINYKVLYYYDSLDHHINERSWIPNVIIVGSFVLQFNYNMTQGIIVRGENYIRGMIKEYENLQEQSRAFLMNGGSAMHLLSIYNKEDIKGGGMIFQQPCMGCCISRDLYEKYLYSFPGKEEFIERMITTRGDWKGNIYYPNKNHDIKLLSFCKWNFVEEFMERGMIREFPDKFYHPLELDDRKKLLDRMIYLVKSGCVSYRFLDDEIMIPENIVFYWDEEQNFIYLNQIKEDSFVQIEVMEQGIYRTFQYYLEYLEKKGMIATKEESLEKLERLRGKYFWLG